MLKIVKSFYLSGAILLLFCFVSCTRYFAPQQPGVQLVAVGDTTSAPVSAVSQRVAAYIKPYHDSLDAGMNTVLVQSAKRLAKGQPESELGNLLCDLFVEMGSQKYGKPIDVALTNSGGVRTEWQAGGISTGNVYEMMPFDNALVVVTLSGAQMRAFAEEFAKKKDPQAGMKIAIERGSNQVLELSVGGQPIDLQRNYTLITSDYVATSSDYAALFKNAVKYEALNYLMRDAILDYLRR
ncbi:MAG: hypothetical protein EAZ70_13510, partial [Runella slithyformis]